MLNTPQAVPLICKASVVQTKIMHYFSQLAQTRRVEGADLADQQCAQGESL